MQRVAIWLVAASILVVMALLLSVDLGARSAVVDEPYHLVRGVAWWWTDTASLSYAHPPLANALALAPVGVGPPALDLTSLPGWAVRDHQRMAGALVAWDWDQARTWLVVGRVGTALAALALGAVIFASVRRRWGGIAGGVALAFIAFNPTILAHGQLLTTDLPATLATTVLVLAFLAYVAPTDGADPVRGLRWGWRTVGLGLATGLALSTKFSAVPVVVLLLVGALIWAAWTRRLARVSVSVVVVAVVTIVVIGACYRFEATGLSVGTLVQQPEPRVYITSEFGGHFLERSSAVRFLPRWLPMPLPHAWVFGVEMIRDQASGGSTSWFFGEIQKHGHPLYFPVLLVLKTPWPVWIGVGLGVVALVRGRRPSVATRWLIGLTLAMVLALLPAQLNLGVRHALPVVPLLSILGAVGAVRGIEAMGAGRRIGWVGLAVVLLWLPIEAVRADGHYLGWFNVGRRAGHAVSIVGEDWGQDLFRLAELDAAVDLGPIAYVPYGPASFAEVRRLGLDVTKSGCSSPIPAGGHRVVHAATVLRRSRCASLRGVEPTYIIADHLWIYAGPPAPLSPARAAP